MSESNALERVEAIGFRDLAPPLQTALLFREGCRDLLGKEDELGNEMTFCGITPISALNSRFYDVVDGLEGDKKNRPMVVYFRRPELHCILSLVGPEGDTSQYDEVVPYSTISYNWYTRVRDQIKSKEGFKIGLTQAANHRRGSGKRLFGSLSPESPISGAYTLLHSTLKSLGSKGFLL